jgi:hypothetical protein
MCLYGGIYIVAGLFVFMFVLEGGSVIVQNGDFRHHMSRATIAHDLGVVRMQLRLQKPLRVDWEIHKTVDIFRQLLVVIPPDSPVHSNLSRGRNL